MTESNQLRSLYSQKQLPTLQNRVYDSKEESMSCLVGDIDLVEDQVTGLIYNTTFRPELLTYDNHYQNEQALSPFFKTHLEDVSKIIEQYIGRKAIVEVGCGKGTFLEMLLQRGFDVTGFDPAYEGANERITRRFFTPESGIRADGLILRHVLEHIQDPFQFLLQLKQANGGSGRIYIEVPCVDWICRHRAWFDVFYEHVNYFRIADFHSMFSGVIAAGHLFGDQYLYVVAELASLRIPEFSVDRRIDFPADFAKGLSVPLTDKPGDVAIWGASSKGSRLFAAQG